jgi:N utilization substance protein B
MIRRKEREFALKVLYALEFNDITAEEQIGYLEQSDSKSATEFSKSLIKLCVDYRTELDKLIRSKLKHWKFERVAVIDRILLRLALTEFLYFEDIPPKVTMDEVIEISKLYSTDKSNLFINGMIDALLKHLQDTGKINKSGRGLISNMVKNKI